MKLPIGALMVSDTLAAVIDAQTDERGASVKIDWWRQAPDKFAEGWATVDRTTMSPSRARTFARRFIKAAEIAAAVRRGSTLLNAKKHVRGFMARGVRP